MNIDNSFILIIARPFSHIDIPTTTALIAAMNNESIPVNFNALIGIHFILMNNAPTNKQVVHTIRNNEKSFNELIASPLIKLNNKNGAMTPTSNAIKRRVNFNAAFTNLPPPNNMNNEPINKITVQVITVVLKDFIPSNTSFLIKFISKNGAMTNTSKAARRSPNAKAWTANFPPPKAINNAPISITVVHVIRNLEKSLKPSKTSPFILLNNNIGANTKASNNAKVKPNNNAFFTSFPPANPINNAPISIIVVQVIIKTLKSLNPSNTSPFTLLIINIGANTKASNIPNVTPNNKAFFTSLPPANPINNAPISIIAVQVTKNPEKSCNPSNTWDLTFLIINIGANTNASNIANVTPNAKAALTNFPPPAIINNAPIDMTTAAANINEAIPSIFIFACLTSLVFFEESIAVSLQASNASFIFWLASFDWSAIAPIVIDLLNLSSIAL